MNGRKVEIYKHGKWIMPKKWCKGMNNPVAILRDIIRREYGYDYDADGEMYRYCDEKIEITSLGAIMK